MDLKRKGMTSILISHKLNEITEVADSITIIRRRLDDRDPGQGQRTRSARTGSSRAWSGRELGDRFPKREHKMGEVSLEVRDWNVFQPLINAGAEGSTRTSASRSARARWWAAGLMGAGRTELAMSVFGDPMARDISGSAVRTARKIELNSVRHAIEHGVSYAPRTARTAGSTSSGRHQENITIAV